MRKITQSEMAIVFLDSFEKLEYKHKRGILDGYERAEALFADNRPISGYFEKVGKQELAKTILLTLKDKSLIVEMINEALVGVDDIVTYKDERYPKELLNTPFPPLVLYVKGNVELLKTKKVSIVGSRKTLVQYEKVCEEISFELSKNGITVVTGIADGGDASAIKGGIKNGNIISVLPGGLLSSLKAPRSKMLINEIVNSGGLVITEHPYLTIPKNYFYPIRNRIIAGLSLGTLIVSGEEDSGARHTANYAVEYGKEVFCLPYGVGVKSGELCIDLVKRGATLVENASEIASHLGLKFSRKEKKIDLSEGEKTLYELIKEGVTDTDNLAERTNMMIFEIISTLGMLELKGVVVKDSSGNYSVIK